MRSFTQIPLVLLIAACLIGFVGCQDSGRPKVAKTDSAQHDDDDHDHDHKDGDHDHDHEHDGDDHDHADHDHEGHDHDGHEHADNYDDAVAELAEIQAKIKEGFSGEEIDDDAHDLLHEVGHILENIEKLVEKSEMDDEAKKSLGKAVDDLFGDFGAVDDKLHDLEGKDYSEVADQIDASIKTLQAQVTKKEKE